MAETETKTHPKFGEVTILERSPALVRIETADGDQFWVLAASFVKKPVKRRAKKLKIVRKVDESVPDLVDDLAALVGRGDELPDVGEEPDSPGEDVQDETEEEESEDGYASVEVGRD